MKIKDIAKKPVLLSPTLSKKDLLKVVKKHPNVDIFMVVDKNKKFLGDVHENDLFYMFLPNEMFEEIGVELAFDLEKKFFAKNVEGVMRRHDVSCNDTDTLEAVAQIFAVEEVNEMPVLNKKGQVVGYVDQGMVLRHMKYD